MIRTNKKSNLKLITFLSFGLLLLICMCPEVCLASGLEELLYKGGIVANRIVVTYGITSKLCITAITSFFAILAIARGRYREMVIAIVVGFMFSLNPGWP